ncbi:MAG: hypothetical protein INQ03_03515 [Candidatus Heimdallarchaeota archaeon]|nr:hypothetical protein [Candidatus Heimdallarchaeota archaeon]
MIDILSKLDGKWEVGYKPKDLAQVVLKDLDYYLPIVLEGIAQDKKKLQSGCSEILSIVSEVKPEVIYPYVDTFIRNLNSERPVLRWEAVCTLGNLISVDNENKIIPHLSKIIENLTSDSIVLKLHSFRAMIKIAIEKKEVRDKIVNVSLDHREYFEGNTVGFLFEEFAKLAHLDGYNRDAVIALLEEYLDSNEKILARKSKKAFKEFSKKK